MFMQGNIGMSGDICECLCKPLWSTRQCTVGFCSGVYIALMGHVTTPGTNEGVKEVRKGRTCIMTESEWFWTKNVSTAKKKSKRI